MSELYKYRVALRHRVTGKRVDLYVWAMTSKEATFKLIGILIGCNLDYSWEGTSPVYSNNELVKQVVSAAI